MQQQTLHADRRILWADLAAVAAVTWMGIHVLRAYVGQLGFIVGADLSFPQTVGLLIGVWCLGMLLWPLHRWVAGPTPAYRGAIALLVVYFNSHLTTYAPAVAFWAAAAAVVWLWYLPALVRSLGLHGRAARLAPGVVLGLSASTAMQAALHGLDLSMLRGAQGILVALLPMLLLAFGLLFGSCREPLPAGGAGESALPGWGMLALSPYYALQLLLLANLGLVGAWSGLPVGLCAAVVLAGLAGGLALQAWDAPYWVRVLGATVAACLLFWPERFAGNGIWLLVPVQMGLGLALPAAFAPPDAGRRRPFYLICTAGAVLFIGLFFASHQFASWTWLWPVLGALAVLPAVLSPQGWRAPGAPLALAGVAVVTALGLGLSFAPRGGSPATGPAPRELTVMNYNIHEAYGDRGTPDPDQVARVIEQSGAGLVGLQEVARGLDVLGGADLVAYLRWRLPEYHLVYGPADGDRQGNVLLSRYPIKESGSIRFPLRVSGEQRGLTWARVAAEGGDLLFGVTHWSAFDDEEEDRLGQAEDVLKFWAGQPRFILVGDLNRTPEGEPIARLLRAGLLNASAAAPLEAAPTWPAGTPAQRLDYIFVSPDIAPIQAHRERTLASDHLPVWAVVRMP